MAPEIGGYLELEVGRGRPYHEGVVELESARGALVYLARLRGMGQVAVPDLMCGAVRAAFEAAGAEVRTYRIGEGLALPADLELAEGEWLYLADYYGRLSAGEVREALALSGGRLVVDEVQGFFRPPWPGADTVYTCRKFFGVPDGAYLATSDGLLLAGELPPSGSLGRCSHLLGRLEGGSGAFYGAYREAEESFPLEPRAMSGLSRAVLGGVDYAGARARREANYALLKGLLDRSNGLDSGSPEGPYMYPYLVADASGARERLASAGVFVPLLWPEVLRGCPEGSPARRYAQNVLPLPVDQRYGEGEMEYVAKEVKRCLS